MTDCDTSSLVVCRTDCSRPRTVTRRTPPVSSLAGPRNARSHKERSVSPVAKSSHSGLHAAAVGLTTWYCVTQFCSGQQSKERRMGVKRLKWNGRYKLVANGGNWQNVENEFFSSLVFYAAALMLINEKNFKNTKELFVIRCMSQVS